MKRSSYLFLRSYRRNLHLLDDNTCVYFEQSLIDFTVLLFFFVFIFRVMSFVPSWIIIVSDLRLTAGLTISNIASAVYPEKLCTLRFGFFDNQY